MHCTQVIRSSDLAKSIARHASFPQTPVSLAQMIAFGRYPDASTILRSSLFLSEELPIRLARRIKSLEDDIPASLASQPAIQRVKSWYTQSFIDMTSFERPPMSEAVKRMLASLSHDNTILPPANQNPASSTYAPDLTTKALLKRAKPLARLLVTSASDGALSPEVFKEFSEYNEKYAKMLRVIKKRHDPTVLTIAEGLRSHRATLQKGKVIEGEAAQVQAFMDKFFINRIGIRLLINQHLELFDFVHSLDQQNSNRTEQTVNVGEITLSTNVASIAHACADNARSIAAMHYHLMEDECPEIIIECSENLQFPYIAGHIAHILFELMKNSLRAVIEHHGKDSESFPAIKVHCYEGEEDITIKISDEGGGIPRSMIRKVFDYSYTTMPTALTPLDATAPGNEELAPLAGFGYGLPLSKLYALAFGGDLRLLSMEGLGTDAFLHLCKLSNTEELLV